MTHNTVKRRARRGGVILAVALVTLLVVMLLGGELIKATVVRHRQLRQAEQRQQSFWLAESAVQRARHALAESPEYEGETWRVPEEVFGTGGAGVAVISVDPSAEPGQGRTIRVQASYPDDPVHRILHERELLVD
jgi:type II secretory pathway component PulK